MPNKKISALPAVTSLLSTDILPSVASGVTSKIAIANLRTVILTGATLAWASITGTPTTLTGYGITDAQPIDADLTALAAMSTTGLVSRTGTATFAARVITGTAGQITVVNGSGISGNPTLSLPSTITQATTFQAASGVVSRAAATQDGVILAGRAGGSTSLAVTLIPTTLTDNRTQTLRNANGNVCLDSVDNVFLTAQTIDRGTGALPASSNSAILCLTLANADVSQALIETFGFGTRGINIRGRAIGGTRASIAATAAATQMTVFSAMGYDGVSTHIDGASWLMTADGLWSPTNRGAFHQFLGTSNGGTGQIEWLRIQNGNVGIGTGASPFAKLHILSGTNNGLMTSDGTVTGVVYCTSSNSMTVGTISNHALSLFTNNAARVIIDVSGNVMVGGSLKVSSIECTGVSRAQNYFGVITFTTPASATAAGTAGHMTWDTNYIYVCTATDTWKRVAIATW